MQTTLKDFINFKKVVFDGFHDTVRMCDFSEWGLAIMLTHVTQCGFHFLLSRLMTWQNIHTFSHVASFKLARLWWQFNQLLLMQPTTNAKWSLNRRDNNSLTTPEDADSTQFYWWLDKSGGKGSSLDFKTFRCSTPSSVGSHERKSRLT